MTKSQLSFRLRQNAPQQTRRESRDKSHKKPQKPPPNKPVEVSTSTSPGLIFPASDTAFKTLLSARFCAAIWSHISDCDETFNYWEPMHYLIFGKGLQTWEYSPQFGLRSYFYLMLHAAPAWIYHKLVQPNPLLMFYFVRCILGVICASCEVYFYKSVCREFGVHIGRICLAFQLFSAGMFISSTSFLPSSFAMYTFAAACASWWQQKYALAIFFTALGSLLGMLELKYTVESMIFALLSPIAITLNYFCVPAKNKCTVYLPYWLSLSPLYLWLLVFMIQEHKEERFLYPVYPLICLSGAITVDIIQKLWFRILNFLQKMPQGTHYLDKTMFIMFISILLTSLLGISRILSLYRNYHASIDLMMELNKYPVEQKISERAQINVCYGKEWHRYPSSFFLPNVNWNIRFIKSEFDGMLPAPYSVGDNATSIVHEYFNDQNREAPELYFDINKCHFLVDTDLGKETALEPNYANQKDRWKVIKTHRFLNQSKSHPLFRSFYILYWSDRYVTFSNFSLLQSTRLKIK
uniref:Mannosyltransferase n=1 Tax=Diabrotica virgifera virgifera TaxID=50390 RepID=A0A6P7FU16_DIAVI